MLAEVPLTQRWRVEKLVLCDPVQNQRDVNNIAM